MFRSSDESETLCRVVLTMACPIYSVPNQAVSWRDQEITVVKQTMACPIKLFPIPYLIFPCSYGDPAAQITNLFCTSWIRNSQDGELEC
jgi:hypothetical protein